MKTLEYPKLNSIEMKTKEPQDQKNDLFSRKGKLIIPRHHQQQYWDSMLGLLGVAFVVLKLTNVIDWSWWWVTAPFWGGIASELKHHKP